MESLSRVAVALAWRVAFATAIMPTIILSGIVMFYPIATIGTLTFLAGGVIASIVAVARTLQARDANRVWLTVASAGIAAWAVFDAFVFHAVWTLVNTSTNQLPWLSTLSVLMWLAPTLGIVGTLVFASFATPSSRRLRLAMLLMFISWLALHHFVFLNAEIGLVGSRELATRGWWIAVIFVAPIDLLLFALAATLSICALRVARSIRRSSAPRLPATTGNRSQSGPLPTAIARERSGG